MAYWLRKDKLVETFELLARNHFIKSERDPTKCALYYLALRKKQVLLGLWRTASGHKEQTKTMKLLANDFTAERWRTAALKNAFALLGKHRYDYAAAFFFLVTLYARLSVLLRRIWEILVSLLQLPEFTEVMHILLS